MKLLHLLLTALQALFLMFWGAFWITLAGVAMVLTRNGDVALMMARRFWAPMHWRINGSRMEVEPLPDIDWSRPHIFLMNHQSALDIPCAFAALPVNLRFVAKHVLRYVPFLGQYMSMTGMIFVDRSRHSAALASLRQAGGRIREGASILAFPEGTRSEDGRLQSFKKGPFMLALEAQVPIVPVAIEGSGRMLPVGSLLFYRGLIRVKVGQPIDTKGLTTGERDALMAQVHDAMSRLHRDIGGDSEVPAQSAVAAEPALATLETQPS
ncbi:1-acyl-sn-glycerol-3-phosphate acyltransferase [Myxococcus sp. K15C18031901]|uniref:lysophospholipid acyltransferase family protein n=1 Tax=Myxococcus dinghuensis TaxID=2906761 RepID=UPI0020A7EC11|nr:lysophospholipid acyltransferase family protein [Myxococcus dinghuensis]MCP3101943.1 1-acyl-sn-glycerol-3-phosphate acyltransferase [Myxococcus dinghuensis]